ncbi:antiterminator Q family protein [Psychrobacter pygoscelis]|uniref:antiterminator Q family protein n=1 Tax=Psychrobacter pygoscelis TaxID=2488563 RepID=UPI00103B85B9|nr:antiterminator Q family protein [Psychrobacter pygoscelis]
MQISSDDLWAFGEWALDNSVCGHLDVKSNWMMLMRDNIEDPDRYVPKYPPISDALADKIDKAIAKLMRHDEALAILFLRYYVYRYTYRQLAERYECSRNKIDKMLSEATGFIIGAVSSEESTCLS